MNPFALTHPVSLQDVLFSLPLEVICHIFQASLTESPFEESQPDEYGNVNMRESASSITTPFTLGAVCRSWRTIAFNDPKLWSAVYLVAVPYRADIQSRLLRDWLNHSKDVGVTIEIDCSCDEEKTWSSSHYREASKLLSPIFEHNSHCTTFRTRLPPDCLLLPPPDSNIPDPDFSDLTTLSIVPCELPFEDDGEEISVIDLFQHASRLQKVEINEVALEQLNISWSKVVKVSTTQVSLKDCMEILRAAPQLEECVFNNITHFEDHCNLEPIVLPRLSALTLDFREVNISNDHITRVLNAPNLKKLEYLHIHGDTFPAGDFVAFMQRSLCQLTHLSIRNSFMTANALRRILYLAQVAPSLEDLYIQLFRSPGTQDNLVTTSPAFHILSPRFPNLASWFFSGPYTTMYSFCYP
ncbi:hypothetical protein AGABI1DRAFT_123822 [Agaricus bisporus var. burnettii JB137-S8]|uniref:Uncharacterized protein n=1 Tax=Agaricus bisporus var. burnettii (strain JB137-S8 / ATCC MYA-4627 / FGSC 10392) TaxID=597362 RepID=K5W9E4_AGABU|nr:uncharacterized protein AGABI1DRAFT_123822 [Agaricus bisporus var. burnettii JB137-S8]EKM83494.1 hypothetical protein AGABI1DRAFT_123822 [Agaricus bisporus var. burnettii JB137-S8]